jgi:galactokinase
MSEEEFTKKCLTRGGGTSLPVPAAGFQPKKRCRHVLTEGARVEKAADASERGDAVALGALMDESHASCAGDYEISCPELDELVSILRKHGALGARLTGAGFGGCTVALVHASNAALLMDGVWRDYYQGYLPGRGTKAASNRETVLFACSPNEGAGIVKL